MSLKRNQRMKLSKKALPLLLGSAMLLGACGTYRGETDNPGIKESESAKEENSTGAERSKDTAEKDTFTLINWPKYGFGSPGTEYEGHIQEEPADASMEITANPAGDFLYHELEDGTVMIDGYVGSSPIMYVTGEIDGKKITSIGQMGRNDTVKYLVLGIDVTDIADNACRGWSALEHVYTYADNLSIGDSAFAACKNLRDVFVFDAVNISKCAFMNCTGLTQVYLCYATDHYLRELHDRTFANCTSLTKVHLPDNLKFIQDNCFEGCDNATLLANGYAISYAKKNHIPYREMSPYILPKILHHYGDS